MLASIRHALDHSAPRLLFCRCVLGFRLQGAGMRAKCSDACSYRAVSHCIHAVSHCVHSPRRPRASRFGFRRRPRASAIAAILSGVLLLLCTMHYLVLFRDMPLFLALLLRVTLFHLHSTFTAPSQHVTACHSMSQHVTAPLF